MPQPLRFGIGRSGWSAREGKNLQLHITITQTHLIRLPFLTVDLLNNFKAQELLVKLKTAIKIQRLDLFL